MFQNIRNFVEFAHRVRFLNGPDFVERDLPIVSESVFGEFSHCRVLEVVEFRRRFPEYHIVSYLGSGIYVNGYLNNAIMYLIGEGDSDPNLAHDPELALDLAYLQSLNSGLNRRRA